MATMTRPRQSRTVRWREDRELPVQYEQEKARQSRHTRSLRSISAMQLRMQQNELDCTRGRVVRHCGLGKRSRQEGFCCKLAASRYIQLPWC